MKKVFHAVKRFFGLVLCFFGIHKWQYVIDNRIFPFTPYKHCKYCGKIKCTFD